MESSVHRRTSEVPVPVPSSASSAAQPATMAAETGTSRVKRGMADMLKGGVIMDVVTPEQAKVAEDAGAVAVMALERVPADIRAQGGVARMSDPDMIDSIIAAVSIPVMAKCRIGHFAEAQVLQAVGVDYIDESEVLTPADEAHHVDKWAFTVPFVCGAVNLGEALRRIGEGAAMIRSKGEAGTGDIVEAVRHMRKITGEIRRLTMLGDDGVFVGSGIFKSEDPPTRARAIVEATTHWQDPVRVAEASRGLGTPMVSLESSKLEGEQLLAQRGW